MVRRWMSPVAAFMLMTTALPMSRAQDPDRPSPRVALRQKIAELRGELALQKLEHKFEALSLENELVLSHSVPFEVEQVRSSLGDPAFKLTPSTKLPLEDEVALLLRLAEKVSLPGAKQNLEKALDEAKKSLDVVQVHKAFKAWLDSSDVWIKSEVEKKLKPLKQAYVRHATAIELRKLELDDLERRYRETR